MGDRSFEAQSVESAQEEEDIEDDRLRLIFTCCHPSLAAGSARGAHQHSIMLHLWGRSRNIFCAPLNA
jgi:predicted RNA polymerase sigma factor